MSVADTASVVPKSVWSCVGRVFSTLCFLCKYLLVLGLSFLFTCRSLHRVLGIPLLCRFVLTDRLSGSMLVPTVNGFSAFTCSHSLGGHYAVATTVVTDVVDSKSVSICACCVNRQV